VKLLSLNLWGGREFAPLMEYLASKIPEVDIFCLQEIFDTKDNITYSHQVRANLWQELCALFMDYHKFYYPAIAGFDPEGKVDYNLTFGMGIFAKRSLDIKNEGDYFTYKERFGEKEDERYSPTHLQYISFDHKNKPYLICNFHGIWFPGDKLDTPNRLEQSQKILTFLNHHPNELKILVGDFNLMPETESIRILDHQLIDLIKQYDIKRTRSKISPFFGTKDEQKYADFSFVSKVNVINFQVPEVEVSDHLPMILEFV